MSNVIEFRTRDGMVGDGAVVPVDDVLTSAIGKLRQVVVLGFAPDGEIYIASSDGVAESNLLIDLAKHTIISQGFE